VKACLFFVVSFIDFVRVVPAGEDAGTQYTWSTPEGAILHLPCGTTRLTCPPGLFRSQAMKHAHSWYKFANSHPMCREIPDGSLYLITGTEKTNSWMVGVFSGSPPGNQVSLHLRVAGAVEGTTLYDYSWVSATGLEHRKCPRNRRVNLSQNDLDDTNLDNEIFSVDAPDGQNHCVFLRGYRIMLNSTESTSGEVLSNIHALSITEITPDDIPAVTSNVPYSETSSSTMLNRQSGERNEEGRRNATSSEYLQVKLQERGVVLEPILAHQEVSFSLV
jgi:hypothetical protein